jgi:hypothetical protein
VERIYKDMIDKIKSLLNVFYLILLITINTNYIFIVSNLTQYILTFSLKLKVKDVETLGLIFFDCIGWRRSTMVIRDVPSIKLGQLWAKRKSQL